MKIFHQDVNPSICGQDHLPISMPIKISVMSHKITVNDQCLIRFYVAPELDFDIDLLVNELYKRQAAKSLLHYTFYMHQ